MPSTKIAVLRSYPIGSLKTTLSLVALKEFAAVPTLMELKVNFVEETYVSEPIVEGIAEVYAVRKSSKTNASSIVLA